MSGRTSLKSFELIGLLGRGSFAAVYKARRRATGELCALKVVGLGRMDRPTAEKALNEVRLLASVSSPHVVAYHEAFIEDAARQLVIVMEFVGGGDLAAKIRATAAAGARLPEDCIWRYLCQALAGLKALHAMRVVHRDVKSANLLLSEDGATLKLGDLNVAKVLKEDLTATQIGSPVYLAPEVWREERYSFNCDVFSLGCVVYELAALRLPFEARSIPDLSRKVIAQSVARLPRGYSDELNAVVRVMLTKDPRLRPSAAELLATSEVRRRAGKALPLCNALRPTIVLPSDIARLGLVLQGVLPCQPLSARVASRECSVGVRTPRLKAPAWKASSVGSRTPSRRASPAAAKSEAMPPPRPVSGSRLRPETAPATRPASPARPRAQPTLPPSQPKRLPPRRALPLSAAPLAPAKEPPRPQPKPRDFRIQRCQSAGGRVAGRAPTHSAEPSRAPPKHEARAKDGVARRPPSWR